MSERTNPGRRYTPSQPHRAQVRRLLVVRLKGHEEVGVAERVRVGAVLEPELAVDVRHHLLVVVVEARYDHLVEVDDDRVPVAVNVAHHAVIERSRARQLHRTQSRLRALSRTTFISQYVRTRKLCYRKDDRAMRRQTNSHTST